MNWEATIAGIALLVSIGTAIFSYNADQESQYRQRSFEVSMFKMQSLEPAMRDASRISSEMNRTLNAMVLLAAEGSGEIYVKKILQSYSDAVDVFNGVRGNLDDGNAKAFDNKITNYERSMFETMKAGGQPTAEQLTQFTNIPAELKTLIEQAIDDLESRLASE